MADPLIGKYLALLGERERKLAVEGTDMILPTAQYAAIVGQRQGLKLAKQLLEQLLEQDDEEESQR